MTPRAATDKKGSDAMGKTKVRTTIEPGVVLTIDAPELLDLERQGLIKSREGDEGWQDDKPDKGAKTEKKEG